ncbi:hypothetical protein [Actinomadura fibrosa]|uniref:Secreted protein n=1 Tax=Actinomadura fibrosa TaxID=111802 RepID=A0ABW2XZD6_9ACTN|nr:hypothetical protein [Actinomadura fibrosa]
MASRIVLATAAATAVLGAVPVTAAEASPSRTVHDPGPLGGGDGWRYWRLVGEYRSSFICNAQGAELVFSGGARDFRCERYDDSNWLYIR